MSIVFYSAPWSSSSPVEVALHELDVPHETVRFDLSKGDQKKPEFLALNPNGKVPTLVVDGTPMFEALAIQIWLGERYGVEKGLWPAATDPARLAAVSWCSWGYVSYAMRLGLLAYATSERLPECRNKAQEAVARKELDGMLAILEERLGQQKYMLGAKFSLVDHVVASVIGYGVHVGAGVDAFPRVKAWLQEFQARPASRAVLQG